MIDNMKKILEVKNKKTKDIQKIIELMKIKL